MLLGSSFSARCQHVIEGLVLDSATNAPLAFVNIVANSNREGTATDIDGKFKLRTVNRVQILQFSYVGYKPFSYQPKSGEKEVVIYLSSAGIELKAVAIYPGENPAHRIIQNAIENRRMNNPEKIPRFQYRSYNKLIYTMSDWEKLQEKISYGDSVERDSIERVTLDFFDRQHLLITESVTERKYKYPNQEKEVVLSTRISGLKHPTFSIVATDLQPFSFYDDHISLLEKEYLSPLSNGSINKYNFTLEDTLYDGKDSIFVISFRPHNKKTFEALQGIISIHTNRWAIYHVKAEPYFNEMNRLRIQQKYKFTNDQYWFPEQLNYDFTLSEFGLTMAGRSYIDSIDFAPVFTRRSFDHITLELNEDAASRSEDFWNSNRADTLTSKEQETYHVIDSLGKAQKYDWWLKFLEPLSIERLPVGFVDVDVRSIYNYNNFEGHRLGLGLYTNRKILSWAALGGYGAYGTKDKEWKYGAALELNFSTRDDWKARLSYRDDVLEPGRDPFLNAREDFRAEESFRNFIASDMNRIEEYAVAMQWRALRYALIEVRAKRTTQQISGDYRYEIPAGDVNWLAQNFQYTTAGVRLRYAFGEKFVQSSYRNVSLGTKYPILWVNATKGFSDLLDGGYDFERYSARLFKRFNTTRLGSFEITVEGGIASGSTPYSELFYGKAAGVGEVRPVIPTSFQTMKVYEFLSDQYVSVFYKHRLGSIRLAKTDKVKPTFSLVQNIGFGSIQQPELHRGIDFDAMEEGLFESGLLIENLYRINYLDVAYIGLGVGAFYRYGAYAREAPIDNLAIKIALTLEL